MADPLNPFWPVADTVNAALELPAVAVTVIGDTAMLKFWLPPVCVDEAWLPQPVRLNSPKHKTITKRARPTDCGSF